MMKIVKRVMAGIALLLAMLALAAVLAPTPKGVLVLEYHEVADSVPSDEWAYNVPPEDFREQLAYLRAEGYETISMLDYAKAKKGKLMLPQKPVVLTFDDGYENNYTTLLPILEEYGMKGTVYMITNRIGREGYLTWNQLRDMQARGMEIGSHTANHIPLTTLSREQQRDELRLSKLMLEWKGMKTIYSFSYPNGAYDDGVVAMLQEEEYLTAVTGEAGLNSLDTNPYRLHRVNIAPPRLGLMEFRLRLMKADIAARLNVRLAQLPDGVRERIDSLRALLRNDL